MYENKSEPIASPEVFRSRLYTNILYALFFLSICLSIGILGYHYTADLSWIDSLHNASMILSGMGPVVIIESTIGKLFSSFYALFSGVAFITNIAILMAPVAHRFFHKLHVDEDN